MTSATFSSMSYVLVVVGTDHHPFHRICRWVNDWVADRDDGLRCTMQIGTAHPPEQAEWVAQMPHSELERLIGEATAVVCHAGPATIMDCLQRSWTVFSEGDDP